MSHQVYLVSTAGLPLDHQAIFVETNSDKSGQVFHVTGSIQNGMKYETEARENPEETPAFVSKELLGRVAKADYSRIDIICRQITPPAKQFDGPKRIDPKMPLRRCNEWAQEAIEALKSEGIFEKSR